MRTRVGRAALACTAALTFGACADEEDRPERTDPFAPVESSAAAADEADRHAAPRWEEVATLRGGGSASRRFTVEDAAIQWRAAWRCESGAFRVSVPSSTPGESDDDARCPARGEVSGFGAGEKALEVEASAPWRLTVEQQVDTGIHEQPLAAMRAPDAEVVASGEFYGVERDGSGRALLHRLPDGRLALRFEGFHTSANTDLFVWASDASKPTTTREAFRAPHTELTELKSTLGDQNYVLPRGMAAEDVRSVVIWCKPIRIAYAAAALSPGE